ncbi:MAG: hypothetical protein A2Y45_08755 [Tenericutes bacterium GWC2_34_14]|nr:MAG: hypothetical protein A2Y45_08755 [Tenericutes bacterium GWC2_34_14]OHE34961.1 MAG: hypothetical protein A2012_02365 [Tenericutes bacterium GWE2_34_108]OHE37179.1 MAG: hypothetical protein A2Y46_00645 [Tenericutes bacterium GWF1_35_14]OHE39689.1 MAG: hypothetical protein A2Y44_02215 [Tenericutes bacterium GWF2_35_184]OHE44123.1 MAG: hypothetical protein A2221_03295 [Tenericutes bacterium RIFOXYA2_FULL_36_32]OHE45468.1 MAG: hypothetical protein A3K26_00900 [Tenericutes bacterium RIFOXYA1
MRILKIMIIILSVGLLFTIAGCKTNEGEVVSVTGITLQSAGALTTITTHAGTLQLSATITPADASDKSITWSVTDGTGSAIINQSGLLSAVMNGTVTVKTVSQSAKAISAELVITISNQVTDNTAPLADAIADANQNMNETMVGTSADQYVSSVSWVLLADQTTYQQAITLAQTTLSETPLTDNEVSDAVNELALATNAFNLKKQNGTKVVLDINLGTAEAFAILSKTGISATGATSVIGDIGVSPVSASYITGFGLIMDSGNTFSTSSLVTGHIYASDYQVGTPALLTSAIADVLTAYQDGASRTADYTELYTGDLSGKTLTSGVYMWSNDVLINTDFTLNGSSTDVFIFQIAGTLTMAANTQITLTGGVLPEHIYWVVADTIAIGVGADFQGIILSMTNVSMNTGSSLTGMIYAQTSVSLDATVVTKP